MRTHILTAIIALFSFSAAYAQTNESLNPEVQELELPSADIRKGRAQFGFTYRYGGTFFPCCEEAFVLACGYRFKTNDYVGFCIGVSRENAWDDVHGSESRELYKIVPVSVDYNHYFPVGETRKHSVYTGAEIGYRFCKASDFPSGTIGASILMAKVGMDFEIYKRLHINAGIRLGILVAGFSAGISF